MRQLLPALLLFAASTALTPLAHADAIDDFVLTGDGHTFRFSLPAVTPAYVNRSGVSGFFTPSISAATVDGVGGYTGSTLFRFNTYSGFRIRYFSVSLTPRLVTASATTSTGRLLFTTLMAMIRIFIT